MLVRVSQLLCALFFFSLAASTMAASISASVDRAKISMDETIILSVRVSPQTTSTPNFSELETQFDIIGRNQNSQYRNINGQIEAFTEWQLTLAPKSAGKLLIPSFQYEQEFSDAIVLEVAKASSFIDDLLPDIYLEIQAENTQPYVQQQVLVTVKLHTAVALRVDDAPALNIPNTLLLPLQDSQYQKRIGDKVYTVSELRYALFPQISGELEIPIQTFTVTARVNASRNSAQPYGQTQTKRIRSKPITLSVKPQPKNYQGDYWLPASNLELKEQWSADERSWVVGEPINRKISISAIGLSGNQIPALDLPESNFYKQYREKPEPKDSQDGQGVRTQISESIAIVPTQEGPFELPEVRLTWWDTVSNKERVATLPARTIVVKANPSLTNTAAIAAPQVPQIQPESQVVEPQVQNLRELYLWRSFCFTLVVTNLLTASLLFYRRTRKLPKTTGKDQPTGGSANLMFFQTFTDTEFDKTAAMKLIQMIDQNLPKKVLNELPDSEAKSQMQAQLLLLNNFAYGKANTYDGSLGKMRQCMDDLLHSSSDSALKGKNLLSDLYPA